MAGDLQRCVDFVTHIASRFLACARKWLAHRELELRLCIKSRQGVEQGNPVQFAVPTGSTNPDRCTLCTRLPVGSIKLFNLIDDRPPACTNLSGYGYLGLVLSAIKGRDVCR